MFLNGIIDWICLDLKYSVENDLIIKQDCIFVLDSIFIFYLFFIIVNEFGYFFGIKNRFMLYVVICFLLFIVGNILLYCLIVIFKISNFNVVLID